MNGATAFRSHADRKGPGGRREFEFCSILASRVWSWMRIGVEVWGVQFTACFPETCGLTSRKRRRRLARVFPDAPKCNVIVKIAPNTRQRLQHWNTCSLQLSFVSDA